MTNKTKAFSVHDCTHEEFKARREELEAAGKTAEAAQLGFDWLDTRQEKRTARPHSGYDDSLPPTSGRPHPYGSNPKGRRRRR
ncbi:hypothetical protein HQ571_00505 [Candidatus Kuenenbacteria bacterium]|nr:hypothetical protein [Candidatus Kuenenbacteria bacterium]